ncbi:hypothetical protein QWY87_04345 [Lutimonas halocynthiae]|uniref:hypothetical protein n=1 Tax=Lutimonas halocynthiae TaxID=1446477 RepID=UPI0025B4CD41|nr:hypothetical protein [Lutimonas halocynthiae]MDN3641916.1 hypothetical protein [Lutimonas halocynthiae]
MKIKNLSKSFFLGILLSVLISGNLIAQESSSDASKNTKWAFLVEPYLMFPQMNGSVGLGIVPDVSVDASANDIFSNLKMGFMLNLEATNGKWTIGSDVLYMSLAQNVASKHDIINGEVTAKQLGWEVSGMYKVTPWLDLGLGGLVNSVKAGFDINREEIIGEDPQIINQQRSGTETWLDPMIIARIKSQAGKKFIYQFRGEIGGFGIGSDLAWQIQAYAGYRFSKLFEMTGGYRIISLDYENGEGLDRFMYDVDTSGPVIRFGFNF